MSVQTFIENKVAGLKQAGLRISLLLSGVFVMPLVLFVGTANAVSYNCPTGEIAALCVYEHSNGGGARTYWGGTWSGTCWNMIPSWNDRVSSVQNNMSIGVTFYSRYDCPTWSLETFYVPANSSATTGTLTFPYSMNDTVSSIYFH